MNALLTRAVRFFWSRFFLLVVCLAAWTEWLCATWVLVDLTDLRPGPVAHAVAFLALLAINLDVRRRPVTTTARSRRLRRIYTAAALTSLFGAALLLVNTVVWTGVWTLVSLVPSPTPWITTDTLVSLAARSGTVGLGVVAATIVYGYTLGARQLRIRDLDVTLRGLPGAFDGLRVAQISDVHLGPYMDAAEVAAYVDRVNELAPDLVVITGDITDGLWHAHETFPALGGLRARFGVVAILGNHDVYTGADDVVAALREHTDFVVLVDEAHTIDDAGARLHVVGLSDLGLDWARGVREHPALPGLAATIDDDEPAILLSHRPDLFGQAVAHGFDLVLSGHTHGGQIALPWFGERAPSMAHFMTRFPRGTFRDGSSTLHVNLGLGVTALPVRVFTPREVTLITLNEAQGEQPRCNESV